LELQLKNFEISAKQVRLSPKK